MEGVQGELHQLFLRTWSSHASVQEWAHSIHQLHQSHSPETFQEALTQYFLTRTLEQNAGSRLLAEHLEYAMAHSLVSFQYFFEQLWSFMTRKENNHSLDTLKTPSLTLHLELLEKFLPSFRFPPNATPENDCLRFLVVVLSICIRTVSFHVRALQDAAFDTSKDFTETILGNIHRCLSLMSNTIRKERFRGLLVLTRHLYPEEWSQFEREAEEVGQIFLHQAPSLYKLVNLRSDWVYFCHSLSLVLQVEYHAHQHTLQTIPLASPQRTADALGTSLPWRSLYFIIQHEVCHQSLRTSTHSCKEILESARSLHQWSASHFYSYLFAATLSTELKVLKVGQLSENKKPIAEWFKARWFLIGRLPLMIKRWEEEAPGLPFYQKRTLGESWNPVEEAILYVADFPLLFYRQGNDYEVLFRLIRSCEAHDLIQRDRLVPRLESKGIIVPASPEEVPLTEESWLNQQHSRLSASDMPAIEQMIHQHTQEAMQGQPQTLETMLEHLIRALTNDQSQQAPIIDLILKLTQVEIPTSSSNPPDSAIPSLWLACQLIKYLGRSIFSLSLLHLHEVIVPFLQRVIALCEILGRVTHLGSFRAAELFAPVLYMLVQIIDKLGVKEGHSNENVFFDLLQPAILTAEWYSRYVHSFFSSLPVAWSGETVLAPLHAYLQSSNEEELLETATPWQILLGLPVVLDQQVNSGAASSKLDYHPQVMHLCRSFFPITLSIAEMYNHYYTVTPPGGSPAIPPTLTNVMTELEEAKAIPPEAKSAAHCLKSLAVHEYQPQSTSETLPVLEMDRASPNLEIKTIFTNLLHGLIPFRSRIMTLFLVLLDRVGRRELISIILREVFSFVPSSPHGPLSSLALHAAELGGCIIGACGSEVVAELLTQSLPLLVPVLTSEGQARMAAQLSWAACSISQIFSIGKDEIARGHYSPMVDAARRHCLLFFTELVERQCRAPSPVLAMPLSFLSLLSADPTIVRRYGSVERLAMALQRIGALPLCCALFDVHDASTRLVAFRFYNALLE